VAALGLFGLFTGTTALSAGAATGSPAIARGLAALVIVASYLINALAQVTTTLRPARPVSPVLPRARQRTSEAGCRLRRLLRMPTVR